MFPNLIILLMAGAVAFFFVIALFQYLWNVTLPQLFNTKLITFWQSFRLLLIAGLLTSGGFIHYNFGR